jgi:hypothetical protein
MQDRSPPAGETTCNARPDHTLGQKRKCPGSRGTSVLPSGADIVSLPQHARLVPDMPLPFDGLKSEDRFPKDPAQAK